MTPLFHVCDATTSVRWEGFNSVGCLVSLLPSSNTNVFLPISSVLFSVSLCKSSVSHPPLWSNLICLRVFSIWIMRKEAPMSFTLHNFITDGSDVVTVVDGYLIVSVHQLASVACWYP
jgi:hypothetical protein